MHAFRSCGVVYSPTSVNPVWLTDVWVWQKSNHSLSWKWIQEWHIHLKAIVSVVWQLKFNVSCDFVCLFVFLLLLLLLRFGSWFHYCLCLFIMSDYFMCAGYLFIFYFFNCVLNSSKLLLGRDLWLQRVGYKSWKLINDWIKDFTTANFLEIWIYETNKSPR